MIESLWTFLAISAVVIMTPGQDTALTIRNTLAGGRRSGILTAIGVAFGQALWALAAALGVVAFLVASEPVFQAVKFAGACYLMFLGAQSLYAAIRPQAADPDMDAAAVVSGRPSVPAFRQGVVSNLGNPKMAVFFASLLPQFVPAGGDMFAGLTGLGLIFCALTFSWLTAYAFAVAAAGRWLRRANVRRGLEAVTGTALMGFGFKIAVSSE